MDSVAPAPSRGFRSRVLDAILPPTFYGTMLRGETPEGFEDCLGMETVVHLGLKDRIRLLFHGHLHVGSFTFTEHEMGKHVTRDWLNTA